MNVAYFHSFGGSSDYLVLPLNSLQIEPSETLKTCLTGLPLLDSMIYDPEKDGQFRIFSKKQDKFLNKIWKAPPFLQLHVVTVFEEDEKLYLDTLISGHGDSLNEYYIDVSFLYFVYQKIKILNFRHKILAKYFNAVRDPSSI
jgi:carotenoid cleavage dioxygenase-like enzyme